MIEQSGYQEKWSKGNQPFSGGKQKFAAVPKQQRSAYNKRMLEAKQKPGPPPLFFAKDYPTSGKFKYQGYSLNYHAIQQSECPKAIIVHIHGMNSHSKPTGYYASIVTKKNLELNFYAFDQMNFGQSEGPFKGQIHSFQDTIQQVETFVDFLLKKLQGKPKIYLSGSSYGGTVVFKCSIKNPEKYSGLIFLAPALKNLSESLWLAKKFGKMIGFMCPRVRLFKDKYDSGSKYNQKQRIEADPHVYNDGAVPGSIRTILNAMDEVSLEYKLLSVPYIFFQAGVEKMIDPFAALDLQEQCKSQDKTTIYCQNMWHAVMAEQEIQGIAWKTGEWLKERI